MAKSQGRAIQRVERMFQNVQIVYEEPDEFEMERIAEIYRMLLQDRPDSRNNTRATKAVMKGLDYQI